jgi:hypothetical protein
VLIHHDDDGDDDDDAADEADSSKQTLHATTWYNLETIASVFVSCLGPLLCSVSAEKV